MTILRALRRQLPGRQHVHLLRFALTPPAAVALFLGGALAPASFAEEASWKRLDRLVDVRLNDARDVSTALRGGPVEVVLPWTTTAAGTLVDSLVVGDGWVELRRAGSPPAILPHATATLKAPDPIRLDVLSGDTIRLGSEGVARVLVAPDGVAVRWAGLSTSGGDAHAEMLLSRTGDVTVQYLRVPSNIGAEIAAGHVLAGAPALPLSPSSATAYRLPRVGGPVLEPRGPALPQATGPPPAGCVPETGTWCERADGPGSSTIYIQQDFDGGYDVGGPFTTATIPGRTQMWHITPYAACPPGATGSGGGQSAYFGSDVTCDYQSLAGGRLLSPLVGPVTATTQFVWSSRIEFEDLFDSADIYINGTNVGGMPGTLDPNLWYNFNPISLAPWAGQMVQIEFRFESDASVEYLGWMVDDVIVWDPAGPGQVDCIRSAGFSDFSPCDQLVSDRWDFYENAFCQGCSYVFYVIVECGREMHIPLWDMEGGDIAVTNMITGAPVPLRCVNQTSRADAGVGSYSAFLVGDVNGNALDCCPIPAGPEAWWGPAFDETDNAGPGRVRWGLDEGCPIFLEYDSNGNGGLECSEVPPTCGGLMSLVSPGDVQVMDCFLNDNSGLCGLYRVDVISGGFLWSLFANCDGTDTPQFQIFHDCTDAWTAYNPLPELAIDSLTTANGCPNLDVSFNVINLGCIDHPGDVPIRITSDCVPPDVLDTVVIGGIPAGGSVPVTVPFNASCSPVRIEVFADPDDIVVECTESSTVAACRTIPGADSLATFTCGCTAQLDARAGADVAACTGSTVVLNASASTAAPCAQPEYRWLDETGGVVQDWRTTTTLAVTVSCPAGRVYTLEVRCQGEVCVDRDDVRVDCIVVTPNAGPDVKECVGTSVTLDGSASTISGCTTPEYRWFDSLGREVRTWGPTPFLNLGPLTCALAGPYTLEVRCTTDQFCTEVDDVIVTCVEVAASAGPDFSTCEGDTFDITWARATGSGCAEVLYAWFDAAGNQLTPLGPDPTFSGSLVNCPGVLTLQFLATCNDPGFTTCGSVDTVDITCPAALDPIPIVTPGCGITAAVDCGVAEPGVFYWWDTDTSLDSDANGDPTDDRDVPACTGIASWPSSGSRTARAWAQEPSWDCRTFVDTIADSFDDPLVPTPSAIPNCAGLDTALSCGVAEPGITYTWDTDLGVDTDGNTVPDDDVDRSTCDTTWNYPTGGSRLARVTATDARGCTSSATIPVDVSSGLPPLEVQDDRVAHGATSLTFTWSALPGAASYRISRGNIGSWYSHSADDLAGQGACDTGLGTTWTDPDDSGDAGDYYYLITAVEPCGVEGVPGDKWDRITRVPRDARIPSGSCP